jgi:hypothetical protein
MVIAKAWLFGPSVQVYIKPALNPARLRSPTWRALCCVRRWIFSVRLDCFLTPAAVSPEAAFSRAFKKAFVCGASHVATFEQLGQVEANPDSLFERRGLMGFRLKSSDFGGAASRSRERQQALNFLG